jgi:hypothetical protein
MAKTDQLLDEMAMNNIHANYTPDMSMPNLPNVPYRSLHLDNLSSGQPISQTDLIRKAVSEAGGSKPLMGNVVRPFSELTSERYPYFVPGGFDNEDAYARGQHWTSQMMSGVTKGLIKTGTTFIQNTAGLINGVAQWADTGNVSSFYNNDFNRALDDFNKKAENWFPNYYTNEQTNARWYSPKKLFTANFFWDGIVKNLGFSAGTMLSGGLFTKVLSSLPLASRLFTVKQAAATLAATERVALAGGNAAKSYGAVKQLSDKFLGSYNLLNPAGRAVVAGLATTGEAGFEAYHNLNEWRDQKIQEYIDIYGVEPTGEDLAEINRISEEVGNVSALLNIGVLSATNYIQFPKVLGSTYRGERAAIASLARETRNIVEKGGQYIAKGPTSTRGRLLNQIRSKAKYTFSASEAFEEGSQSVIGNATEDYFSKKYNDDATRNFLQSIIHGAKETVTTDEGMEELLIGGLSGAIMLGKSRYTRSQALKANTAAAVDVFNKFRLSQFTKDTFDAVNRGTTLQQEREAYIEAGNIIDSKDAEFDYIINYLAPRIKYGRFDLVMQEISDYRQLASTQEGFNQLVEEGKVVEGDTREAYLNRINSLDKTANNVLSLYQSLHLRYANVFDEQGNRMFDDAVMDKLVYAASKIADYDVRLPQLRSVLLGAGITNVDQVAKDIVDGKEESYDKAVQDLNDNKNITETQREEIGQSLNDFLELSLRRAGFIQEYDKIKGNPENYRETPVVQTDGDDDNRPKNTITLKTKAGERDIETNTPYFVGRVVEYDKDGNEVYRSPVIEVLEENADGTIKIKTDKGEIKDVKPSVIEDYNLAKVSSTKDNKKAMFFMKVWNTLYDHYGIKDKNGKPVRGRFEYGAKDNALIFTYKDDDGKIRRREVTNKMLVAKEGFKHAMLRPAVTLHAAQKQASDAFAAEKTSMSEQMRIRNSIIQDLYTKTKDNIAKLEKKLLSNQKKLDANIKKVDELTKTKDGKQRKKFTATMRKAINDLSKLREDLQEENNILTAQKEELETNMYMFKDFLENVDVLPDTMQEVTELLRNDTKVLSDSIEVTEDAIKNTKSMMDLVDDTIQGALQSLSSYIKSLKRKNPKIPFTLDKLQEHLDRYLDEKGDEQFRQERAAFIEELLELEGDIADFLSELNLPELAGAFKNLPADLNDLQQGLSDLSKEYTALKEILDVYEKALVVENERIAQEEALAKNDELVDKLIGTADDGEANERTEHDFEPDKKKATNIIPIATIGKNDGKAHQERANTFGFNLNKFENRDDIRGVYVTATTEGEIGMTGLMDRLATDDNGEVNENVDKSSIIAMVMVVEQDGQLKPVGVDGQVLQEGADLVNEGIYQVMPLGELKWANNDSMFRNDAANTKAVQESIREQYTEWRNNILSETEISQAHEIEASFGILEQSRDADGKVIPNSNVSALDAGLLTDADLEADVVVFIPETNDTVEKGTVAYRAAKGKAFVELPNGMVPLRNRNLNKKEAETIYSAILQVAKNMLNPEVGIEGSSRILEYLKGIVYWGIPHHPNGKRKPAGYNSVFFEKNAETGKLVLNISGKGGDVVNFTPIDLENNKEHIIHLLQNIYNNANRSKIRKLDQTFEELVSINSKGEPKFVLWPNYQTYLLSNKDTEGKQRSDIPFTVAAKPLETSTDVNRTGIYFYRTKAVEDFVIPEPVVKASKLVPGKTATQENKGKKQVALVPEGQLVMDGESINTFTTAKGLVFKFSIPEGATEASQVTFYPQLGDGQEVMDALNAKGRDGVADIKTAIFQYVQNFEESTENTLEEYTIKGDEVEDGVTSPEDVADEIPPARKKRDVKGALGNKRTGRDKALRLQIIDRIKKFKKENWNEVEGWLKKNIPNVPVFRVKNVMMATNGRMAWGAFKDGALYVYQNAEVGTTYHEAFHAIWRSFTSLGEQQSIINEFKLRKGEFLDRPSGENIKYSEATEAQIEEQLAEEFRDYVQFKKIPPRPSSNVSFLTKMFRDIVNFIKSFITGRDAQSKVEEMFKNINTGKYSTASPLMGELSTALQKVEDIDSVDLNDDFVLRQPLTGINDRQRRDILEHLTYLTITNITANDESLFKSVDLNGKLLYNVLNRQLITKISETKLLASELLEEGYTAEDVQPIIDETNLLIGAVESQWDNIVDIHKEHLASYQITFDEGGNLQVNDQDKVKESDYLNATQIDTIRRANPAVKLLLSTVAVVDNDGYIIPSSIGGVNVLPMSKVFITMMNNLHTSRGLDEMITRLHDLAKSDSHYRALYQRIVKRPYTQSGIDLSKIQHQHGAQLLSAIWQTFKKQNPDVKNVFVLESGEVVIGDANLSDAASQLREDFINAMIMKAKKGSKFFLFDKKKKAFIGSPGAVKNFNINSPVAISKFLNELGIVFTISEIANLGKNYDKFKEAVIGIKQSLMSGKEIVTVSGKTLSMAGRLLELGAYKHVASSPEFDSTFFNVEGERSQSFIGINSPSNLHDFLSSLTKFTREAVADTEYRYLVTDSFSKGSVILKRMFTSDGSPKKGSKDLMKVGWVSGVRNEGNGKNTVSAKLTFKDRLSQELSLNEDGWYLNLVPGDSSTEWMIHMGNHVSKEDLSRGMDAVHNIFKEYFMAELELSREGRNVARGRNAEDLRFFHAILGDKLTRKVTRSKTRAPEDVYNANELSIKLAVRDYINKDINQLKQLIDTYQIADVNTDGMITLNGVKAPTNMTAKQYDKHLEFLTVNYIIANIEMHKLLYADPFQYSDELKRIKSSTSPRQALIHNSSKTASLFQRVYNIGFPKGHPGHTDFKKEYFKTATHGDVMSIVDLPNYKSHNETDGGGIINLKGYRRLRILAGMWTDSEERQYAHDMEYENMIINGATNQQLAEFNKANPRVKSAFTPLKPIVFGNRLTNDGDFNDINDLVLDKYSLYPVSLRLLHEMNPNSNAVKLYEKMLNEDIDYIIFESGRKVGAHVTHSTYNDNGSLNMDPYGDSVINIPNSALSIQTEVPSKDNNLVKRGSQITKLATVDMMDAGVPMDFMVDIKDFNERFETWNNLTDEQKKSQSPLYKEIKNNQTLLEELTEKGYVELLQKLGIRETAEGYQLIDRHKAGDTLRQELLKREVNDNLSSAITDFIKGTVLLEATPAYQQVRNILYSIVDKNVISPKITGGMKVQIPSTFFESGDRTIKEVDGSNHFQSDILKFYEDVDGERVMEIMVGRWFESEMSDAELLDYFNNTEEGQKILRGVAFRTPTQQQNSIDAIRIKNFLPREFGDSVVVPSALVQKAGSDFDIDKLSIYLKNIFIGKGGKPVLMKLLTDENSTVVQRHRNFIKRSVENFKQVKRDFDETSVERSELNKQLEQNFEDYLEDLAILKGDTFGPYRDKLNEVKRAIEENVDASEHIYSLGYVFFKELPISIRQQFYDRHAILDKMVKDGEIMNFEKTVHFKIFAQEWLNEFKDATSVQIEYKDKSGKVEVESVSKRSVEPKLKSLIKNYDLFLNAIGWTQEAIDDFNDNLQAFKQEKEYYDSLKVETKEKFLKPTNLKAFEKFTDLFYNTLVDTFNLPTLEEFSKLSIHQQNSREALENEYIQSLENLISHPQNFERLVQPNSAKVLQDLAQEIAERTIGESFNYTDVGNLINRRFMSSIRHAFISGKYAIGIAAVSQTNNSMNQRQPMYIDPARLENVSDQDRKFLGKADIKFKQHNRIAIGGKSFPTLSMVYNKAGHGKGTVLTLDEKPQRITDLISQFIDGYVDISKGPWIMQLGATKNVTGTFLFLIKIGVPINDVAYFMNQPIIRDYLIEIENSGYSWLYIDTLIEKITDKYELKNKVADRDFNAALDRFMIPDTKTLQNSVGKNVNDMSNAERFAQLAMLSEFLKYSKMAQHLFHVTQGSNFDTANFNDPFLLFKKQKQLEKARQTIISDVDSLIENSFLGKLVDKLGTSRDAISEILISDKSRVRNIIENVLEPFVDMNDREFVKLARKTVNDLFDWAVQNDQEFNKYIKRTMIDDGGFAAEILDFVNDVKSQVNHDGSRHPLYGNFIIDSIVAVPSRRADEGVVNNIKIKNLQNKVDDQNSIIHSFRELRQYLQDVDSNLYSKIVTLAVLQSGVTNSSISFTNLLPYEDFQKIYNQTLFMLDTISNLEDFNNLNVFQRNNWVNPDIVPYMKAKLLFSAKTGKPYYNLGMSFRGMPHIDAAIESGKIPHVVKIASMLREAQSDFIVYSWEKQADLLTEAEKKKANKDGIPLFKVVQDKKREMREVGDYSYINKGLFEKVRDANGDPLTTSYKNNQGQMVEQHVYKMINGWGDGYRANEFYDVDKPSVINNGLIKTNTVADSVIIDVFEGKVAEKAKKSNLRKAPATTPTKSSLPSTANFQVVRYNRKGYNNLSIITDYLPERFKKGYSKFYTQSRNAAKEGNLIFERAGKPIIIPGYEHVELMMEQDTNIIFEVSTGVNVFSNEGFTQKRAIEHVTELFSKNNVEEAINKLPKINVPVQDESADSYHVTVDNKGKESTFVLDESGVVEGRAKEKNELKELYRRLRAHDKPNEVKPEGLPPIPKGPEKC